MRSRQAVTLVELLISSSLFLLALGMCGMLAQSAVKGRNRTLDQNGEFRQSYTQLQLLQRDVLLARQIYWPDTRDYSSKRLGLVLRVAYPEGRDEVVFWSHLREEMIRQIYRSDYDPSSIPTHQPKPGELPKSSAHLLQTQQRFLPPGENGGAGLLELRFTWGAPVHQELTSLVALPL
jgi:hypothetical protein